MDVRTACIFWSGRSDRDLTDLPTTGSSDLASAGSAYKISRRGYCHVSNPPPLGLWRDLFQCL